MTRGSANSVIPALAGKHQTNSAETPIARRPTRRSAAGWDQLMGHCIQAIVVASEIADRLRAAYPQLRCVSARQGYMILPIDADFVDSVTGAQPPNSTDTFMLLTEAFGHFLRELSRFGPLAYIETEYFGGIGGQGAAVYAGREVILAPEWRESGVINRALKQIGMRRRPFADRFMALGLDAYRSNDDLMEG